MYALVLATALTTGGVAPQYLYDSWGCAGFGVNYGCWGCYGSYGSCRGGFGYAYESYVCNGGYAGHGGHGWAAPMPPAGPEGKQAEPGKKIQDKSGEPGKKIEEKEPGKKGEDESGEASTPVEPSRALLQVEVPAEARLYINGRLMRAASAVRAFDTPPLGPGRAYSCMLRAEVVRGGKTVSDTRQVEVRPGR
jgi:uncharacterized protein (TIGR03000 family)